MPIDKTLVDAYVTATAEMVKELTEYAAELADDRTPEDDGQVRRLAGISGSLAAAVQAAARPVMTPVVPPAPLQAPPAAPARAQTSTRPVPPR